MEHLETPSNGHAGDGRHRELLRAVEALLFAADEPLTDQDLAGVIAAVMGGGWPGADEVPPAVAQLNASYAANGRAFYIQRWAGGYRMTTSDAVAPYLKAFFKQDRRRRLSRSLMETLAILAYRQPATKPEVDFVRGVDSDYALRKLLEMGLVDVVGRSESVGRPLLYGTTAAFLEAFGLDTLADLPNLRELEALLDDPAFNREKARLLMVRGLDGFASLEPDAPGEDEAS